MNVRDLVPEQHKKQRDHVVAQVLQTGEPIEYEIEYLRKNGSQVPVSIAVFAVMGDDGKPTGRQRSYETSLSASMRRSSFASWWNRPRTAC